MSTLNTYNLKSPDSANTNLALDASGNVAIQAGSASTPSVYVTGDANTGLYSPGADQVALTTGGTARLYIDSSGRVGIGTTTVNAPLEVRKNGAGEVLVARFANHNTNEHYLNIVVNDDSNTVIYDSTGSSGGDHIWRRGGAESARIDSSGRLLVGTSTGPSAGQGQYSRIVAQGNTANGAGSGELSIQRGETATSITVGEEIGAINFNDNAGNTFAIIRTEADATAGSGDYPGRLVFSTTADGASSPTERMRITQNGAIRINLTGGFEDDAKLVVSGNGTNPSGAFYQNSTSSLTQIAFGNPNGSVGTIVTSGSATAYNTSSDYRLKENVTAVTDGITRLQQLKPSRFNFIADPDKTVDGFIAHEVQAVVPEAITGEKDAEDDDGNPIYQGIDQSKLVPLLTAALQEAIGRIEALEAEVTTLKAQ